MYVKNSQKEEAPCALICTIFAVRFKHLNYGIKWMLILSSHALLIFSFAEERTSL